MEAKLPSVRQTPHPFATSRKDGHPPSLSPPAQSLPQHFQSNCLISRRRKFQSVILWSCTSQMYRRMGKPCRASEGRVPSPSVNCNCAILDVLEGPQLLSRATADISPTKDSNFWRPRERAGRVHSLNLYLLTVDACTPPLLSQRCPSDQ